MKFAGMWHPYERPSHEIEVEMRIYKHERMARNPDVLPE